MKNKTIIKQQAAGIEPIINIVIPYLESDMSVPEMVKKLGTTRGLLESRIGVNVGEAIRHYGINRVELKRIPRSRKEKDEALVILKKWLSEKAQVEIEKRRFRIKKDEESILKKQNEILELKKLIS